MLVIMSNSSSVTYISYLTQVVIGISKTNFGQNLGFLCFTSRFQTQYLQPSSICSQPVLSFLLSIFLFFVTLWVVKMHVVMAFASAKVKPQISITFTFNNKMASSFLSCGFFKKFFSSDLIRINSHN